MQVKKLQLELDMEQRTKNTEKRREVKDKQDKERYTHLTAEFQRTARRDKKAMQKDRR